MKIFFSVEKSLKTLSVKINSSFFKSKRRKFFWITSDKTNTFILNFWDINENLINKTCQLWILIIPVLSFTTHAKKLLENMF